MINKLYDNCFTAELSTRVLEVRGDSDLFQHVYKDTIFCKGDGGMASDIGMIGEYVVLDLKYKGGHIWHLLDTRLEGAVSMGVNLHERFRKCQTRTAQYLTSTVLDNVYKVETLAHHVGGEENDIEFSSEDFTDKIASELQVLCNGLIRDDLEVSIQYPTRVEANKMTKGKNLDRDDLRVMRIGALDYNMCGCMHVPSLRCLQMLYISGYEKTAEGCKIRRPVGGQLLDCVSRRYKMLDEVSRSLAVSHLYVNTSTNRLINKTRQLNQGIVVWEQKYYEMFGKELGQSEKDIIIHFFDDIGVKSGADIAKYITENCKKAIIFVAKTYGNVYVVVAPRKGINFDSAKVFKEIADVYHLRRGGSARLSQGGGMYFEETIKFVKTHRFS